MPPLPSNTLLGLNSQELTSLALDSGQPAYRGQQLFDAVYRQRIETLDQISTLPREYREGLGEQGWRVGLPSIAKKFVSSDGTVRYLMALADGETVETVWMPEGDDGETGDARRLANKAIA
jgi:23S rRNA (adenine2503-C2)-methyltransferase